MRFFNFILLLFCSLQIAAQQFGAFPPSIKWRQIGNDTVRIIFQPDVKPDAERIAAIIQRMAKENPNPLGNRVRKINTVLHNYTTLANGYVALAPFRSEYYLIPSTDIFSMGANPWQEELAVHEYRHVLQNSNLNRGLSRVASTILGEEGQALLNAMAVPDWFYEGDAVHAETALTPQGRGRIPNFFNGYRSLFRENKNYSWMKLRNGSLKDYVPNHYETGYLLVNYGYLKYGTAFWGKVVADAAAYKSLIYPFQSAFKNQTGQAFEAFRNEAFEFYSKNVNTAPSSGLETVTRYYFPQFAGDDSLIYLKAAYDKIPAFYLRDSKGEHRLTQQNISSEKWFGYRNGRIVYTAYDVHPRWNLVDYSNIITYNIFTGEEKKLTSGAKYFTPDLSPAGNQMIAVFVNDSARSELHLVDDDGEVLKTFPEREGGFYLHPRFIDEQHVAYAVRWPDSRMSLQQLNIATGEVQSLIAPTAALLGHLSVDGNNLYFNSSLRGRDDMYVMRLNDNSIYRINAGPEGNYYPAGLGEKLTYSTFTASGLQMKTTHLDKKNILPVQPEAWSSVDVPYKVAGADSLPNLLNTDSKTFPVSNYRQSAHLFNFHSWRPYFTDPEYTFSLYSDNLLNTFSNEVFYRYNQNESSHAVGLATYYGGFFPVLNASVTYTMNRTIRTVTRTVMLNEFEVQGGYYIPLNFTGGNTFKSLVFGNSIVHNKASVTGLYRDSLRVSDRNYLSHAITWSQRLPRATQHIYPKFGYALSANLRHFINSGGSLSESAQWLFNSQVSLPSVANNHSIVVSGSYQQIDTLALRFSNRFSNSRGYSDYYFRKMWRLSGNYHFPIIYPDWGFANILYLLRLRGNVFYDHTKAYSGFFNAPPSHSWNLRSIGAELYFDSKWWNQLPVTFGFRVSRLLDRGFLGQKKGDTVFEFIVPVDLIPR